MVKFLKTNRKLPKVGDMYYCKIDLGDGQMFKTIVEWYKYPNGNYDWALEDVKDCGENAKVVEWLCEIPEDFITAG